MWTVTRQSQWPEGTYCVEISTGDINYSNPGMLVEKYDGEGKEYTDPREAVEAAIAIAKAWRADVNKGRRKDRQPVTIAQGSTGGMTMPFEGEPLTAKVFKALREWANEEWEKIPKCDQCGKPIFGNAWHNIDDPDMGSFCSEYCCEKAARFHAEQELEFQVDELDEEQCRAILVTAGYELDETDTLESMRKLIMEDVKAGEIEQTALRV